MELICLIRILPVPPASEVTLGKLFNLLRQSLPSSGKIIVPNSQDYYEGYIIGCKEFRKLLAHHKPSSVSYYYQLAGS